MFVGMDLHKNYLQIAVMNEKGKVLENSRIKNNLKHVGRFFDENINDEKVRVAMESSSVWYNIYSYLSKEKHLNVVLSNPVKTRAIASAKIKTDTLRELDNLFKKEMQELLMFRPDWSTDKREVAKKKYFGFCVQHSLDIGRLLEDSK
jgi:hypothetical protein